MMRSMRSVLGLLYAYETTWSKSKWGTAANVNEAFYGTAGPPGRRGAEAIRKADHPWHVDQFAVQGLVPCPDATMLA